MFGNLRNVLNRPPITSFQVTLNLTLPTTGSSMLSGLWVDNAGCRSSQIFGGTTAALGFSVEQLACNDGDMIDDNHVDIWRSD